MRTKGDRQKASMQNPVNAPQQARVRSTRIIGGTEKGGDEVNSRAVAAEQYSMFEMK
jgi:hypothetical protein